VPTLSHPPARGLARAHRPARPAVAVGLAIFLVRAARRQSQDQT